MSAASRTAVEPNRDRIIRATVVQAAPVAFDRERTLDRVAQFTAEAAADRAQLVVFPEAFVSGYPKGADFGAVVGIRSREGRDYAEALDRRPGDIDAAVVVPPTNAWATRRKLGVQLRGIGLLSLNHREGEPWRRTMPPVSRPRIAPLGGHPSRTR